MSRHRLSEAHGRAIIAALKAPLELTRRGYFDTDRRQSFRTDLIGTLVQRGLMAPRRSARMNVAQRSAWSAVELTDEGRQRAQALLEILFRLQRLPRPNTGHYSQIEVAP